MSAFLQTAGLSMLFASPWLIRTVMLGLLAWLGAGIFWSITTPVAIKPPATWEIDPHRAAQSIAAHHLFGTAPSEVAPMAVVAGDIRLFGVIAGPGDRYAFALLATEGSSPQVVRQGDDVVPGVLLQRVMPRQVELLRGGQIQTLSLPERSKP